MYFTLMVRHNPEKNKSEGYYRLVESYRNMAGRPCHRTLLNLGFSAGAYTPEQLNQVQRLLNQRVDSIGQGLLFEMPAVDDEKVLHYVDELFEELVRNKKIDLPEDIERAKEREAKQRAREEKRGIHRIDIYSIRSKDVREIGGENLCYQALLQLGLHHFLLDLGWGEQEVALALTQIISRTVYPASEFETVRWIEENSAVCEVTGYDVEKITKDKLYGMSKRLFAIKDEMEKFLSHKTNTLFELTDKILLFDLTNTYYEGVMTDSKIAKRGRSKEKRSDAKLIVLALVINVEGFIKFSALFDGNMSDSKSLGEIIDSIRGNIRIGSTKPLVVIDAGIATEENLRLIAEKGYDYLCVSRSSLLKYGVEADTKEVITRDIKKQKIVLCKVKVGDSTDYYLKVHSQSKELKERSMNQQFAERYQKELDKIALSITKKGGVKQLDKVNERIGRAKQKYPSIHRFYDITLTDGKQKEKPIAVSLQWSRKEGIEMNQRSGIYFLRTSLTSSSEDILWQSYNAIREIESSFRTLKTELDLRPIYHKKDDSSMAHLHLGLLAYWVVNTIRHQLKQKGIKHQWREIVRIMNTQKAVTTIAQNDQDKIIVIRHCTEPTHKTKELYDALKYKYVPFTKRKSVVHKSEIQ